MNQCLGTGGGGETELVGNKTVVEDRTQLDAHSTIDKAEEDLADGNRPSAASRLSAGESGGRAEVTAYRGGDVGSGYVLGQLQEQAV